LFGFFNKEQLKRFLTWAGKDEVHGAELSRADGRCLLTTKLVDVSYSEREEIEVIVTKEEYTDTVQSYKIRGNDPQDNRGYYAWSVEYFMRARMIRTWKFTWLTEGEGYNCPKPVTSVTFRETLTPWTNSDTLTASGGAWYKDPKGSERDLLAALRWDIIRQLDPSPPRPPSDVPEYRSPPVKFESPGHAHPHHPPHGPHFDPLEGPVEFPARTDKPSILLEKLKQARDRQVQRQQAQRVKGRK
jgi:hypothetical protein